MLIGIIGIFVILVSLILYGCLKTSTDYDKQVEDDIQEAYLKQYQKAKVLKSKDPNTSKKR